MQKFYCPIEKKKLEVGKKPFFVSCKFCGNNIMMKYVLFHNQYLAHTEDGAYHQCEKYNLKKENLYKLIPGKQPPTRMPIIANA